MRSIDVRVFFNQEYSLSSSIDIMKQLTIGQIFSIDNPPHHVMREEWTIIEFSYPNIRFSFTKYWVRDMAYIHISTPDTVAGRVIKETDYGVIIEFNNLVELDVGLCIKGDKASYFSSLE